MLCSNHRKIRKHETHPSLQHIWKRLRSCIRRERPRDNNGLSFEEHISLKVKKSNATRGVIRRSFLILSGNLFKRLYVTFVRPNLECAKVVWAPHLMKYINMIENVQIRTTKLVDWLKNLEYSDRLKIPVLPIWVWRRAWGDMIEIYKHLYAYDKNTITTSRNIISRNHEPTPFVDAKGRHERITNKLVLFPYCKNLEQSAEICRRHHRYIYLQKPANLWILDTSQMDPSPKDTSPTDCSSKGTSPTDNSPTGHFPDGHFPDRTLTRPDTSPTLHFYKNILCWQFPLMDTVHFVSFNKLEKPLSTLPVGIAIC